MAKAAAAAPVPIDVIGPGTPEPGPLRGGRPSSISAAVSCSEICDRPPRRIIEKQSSCVMPSASERHSVVEGRPVGVLRAAEARARGCPQRREREPAAGRSSWNRSQFGQGRVDARRRETCPVTRRTSACVLRLQHVASVRSRLLPSARRLTAGGGELSGVLVRQAQAKLTLRADRTIGGCRVVILVGMVREHSDPSLTKLGVTTTLHAARHRWDQSPPLPPSKLRPALAPLVA